MVVCAGVAFGQSPQPPVAAVEPQAKGKLRPKTELQSKKVIGGPIHGFAVAPMVLTDEGCARDYVRAFQFEGVELRKRLTDLETYHCIDSKATGIFAGVSIERKDFAVDKEHVAYFRNVVLKFDPQRTSMALDGRPTNPPGETIHIGWIPEKNFYAMSPEQFDQLLAQKKIPMAIR